MKLEFGSLKILGDVQKNACVHQTLIFNFKWISIILFLLLLIIFVILYLKNIAKDEKEDYYVTQNSGIVHNATCRHYGKTKGFYLAIPGGYRNCRVCGGATWKKKGSNENRKTQ